MSAQVPEWVRVFEAVIIGLGLGTFLCVVFAALGYVIRLTVKGVKALFRRKGKKESEAETVRVLQIASGCVEIIKKLKARIDESDLEREKDTQYFRKSLDEFLQTVKEQTALMRDLNKECAKTSELLSGFNDFLKRIGEEKNDQL